MKATPEPVLIKTWLVEPMSKEVLSVLERVGSSADVRKIAVMPDVHVAGEVCVGMVIATSRLIYPAAVGGDIGCGMSALSFDCAADVLADARLAARIMDGLYNGVPANRRVTAVELDSDLAADQLSAPSLERLKWRDGAVQLGTLGRGNHFLELHSDQEGRLWLMVHSGSRGMGQAIRDYHVGAATSDKTGLAYLDSSTPAGQAYLSDAAWAVRYAEANRRLMAEATADVVHDVFGVDVVAGSYFGCDHNHVRRETHAGQELLVHRKGAAPAGPGVPGIIPGSMGSVSFHVEVRGCAESMCSSAHGAGRAMSRKDAARKISARALGEQMAGVWFDRRKSRSLREEAPRAYKDIGAVMRAQRDLVKVVRRLRPMLSYKGV